MPSECEFPLDFNEKREEEIDSLFEKIALFVVKKRLVAPSIMMLELNKPLCFIASQSILTLMPFLGAFVGPSRVELLSEALKTPQNVERLIQRIEDLADEPDPTK